MKQPKPASSPTKEAIKELLRDFGLDIILCFNDAVAVHALYHRLAAEAVEYLVASWAKEKDGRITVDTVHGDELALPLHKLKAIMEIKE